MGRGVLRQPCGRGVGPWATAQQHQAPAAAGQTEPPSLRVRLCWSGSYSRGQEDRPWVMAAGRVCGLRPLRIVGRVDGAGSASLPHRPESVQSAPGSHRQDLRGNQPCRPRLGPGPCPTHSRRAEEWSHGPGKAHPLACPKADVVLPYQTHTEGPSSRSSLAVRGVGKKTLSSCFHLEKSPCKLDVSGCISEPCLRRDETTEHGLRGHRGRGIRALLCHSPVLQSPGSVCSPLPDKDWPDRCSPASRGGRRAPS